MKAYGRMRWGVGRHGRKGGIVYQSEMSDMRVSSPTWQGLEWPWLWSTDSSEGGMDGKKDRRDRAWKNAGGIALLHLTRQVNWATQLQCCSLWNCPCGSAPGKHSTMEGWTDEEEDRRDGGRVSLGGLAKWAESKWCWSTLADSMAPLITFNQSCVEGPSQPHYQTPPVSHLLSSFSPLHSIFFFFFFTIHTASHTIYQTGVVPYHQLFLSSNLA